MQALTARTGRTPQRALDRLSPCLLLEHHRGHRLGRETGSAAGALLLPRDISAVRPTTLQSCMLPYTSCCIYAMPCTISHDTLGSV